MTSNFIFREEQKTPSSIVGTVREHDAHDK
ncbi:hypothetical protein FG05_35418 [Fusarium graminearum]|nr:hypothetical protein FG05_35418 [Fusarium graminearum]